MSRSAGQVLCSIALVLFACGDQGQRARTKQEIQDACLDDAGLDAAAGYYDEPLSDAVCRCIVDSDERPFGESSDLSEAPLPVPDDRADDPAYAQWHGEIRRTRCGCCHNSTFLGPGTAYWDLSFASIWTDSVSDVRLRIMAGETDRPGQTLPWPDLAPFRAFAEAEIARREAARAAN